MRKQMLTIYNIKASQTALVFLQKITNIEDDVGQPTNRVTVKSIIIEL